MAHTRWLDEDEQRTWRSFLTASRLLWDRVERQLQQDSGLPHTYYEILVQLSEAPERRLRMSQLAANSLSSRSRLSHAVARMEASGWIRRSACPDDRRGALAELTAEGMATLEAAAPGHVEAVRAHLFDVLTAEQLGRLREISDRLGAHLGVRTPGAVEESGTPCGGAEEEYDQPCDGQPCDGDEPGAPPG